MEKRIVDNPGFRIEVEGEKDVLWASDESGVFVFLVGLIEDRFGTKVNWKHDYGKCFMNKTKEEKIIACVYDCPNCEERKLKTKQLLVVEGNPPKGKWEIIDKLTGKSCCNVLFDTPKDAQKHLDYLLIK